MKTLLVPLRKIDAETHFAKLTRIRLLLKAWECFCKSLFLMSPSLLSNFDCAEKKKKNLECKQSTLHRGEAVGVRHFDELLRSCHMRFGKSGSHDVVQLKWVEHFFLSSTLLER